MRGIVHIRSQLAGADSYNVITKHITGDDCQLLMGILNLLPEWLSFSNFNRTLKFCIIKSYTWIQLKKVFPFLPKVTKESEFSGSPVTSRDSYSQHILNKCAFLVDEWHFSLKKKWITVKSMGLALCEDFVLLTMVPGGKTLETEAHNWGNCRRHLEATTESLTSPHLF